MTGLGSGLELTLEEKEWLTRHTGKIRLAPGSDREPMEFFDPDGNHTGIVADYIRLIEKKLDFKFNISAVDPREGLFSAVQNHHTDVISAAQPTHEQRRSMNWSKPYIHFETVIIMEKSFKKKITLDQMAGMKIGMVKGSAVDEFIRRSYPHLDITSVINGKTGLYKTSLGELDAMIIEAPYAFYEIEKEGITNLGPAGHTGLSLRLAMGIRKDWPVLARIVEKCLADMTAQDHRKILSKWIFINPGRQQGITRFWAVFSVLILAVTTIIILLVVWNIILKKQVSQRTEALCLNEKRLEALLELTEKSHGSLQETIEFAFEQMTRLTRSRFGFLAFSHREGIILSTDPQAGHTPFKNRLHQIPQGFTEAFKGLWGEAVIRGKGVISNQYEASNPFKAGLPRKYRPLNRYMNVPIFKDGEIVLVAGVGNKPEDYDPSDLRQLTLLASGIWRILQRKQSRQTIYDNEKSLRDIVDQSPNGIVIIQNGRTVFQNPRYYDLTGDIEPENNTIYKHIHPEDLRKTTRFFRGINQGSPIQSRADIRFFPNLEKKNDQTMKWVSCQATPIIYKEGKAFLITLVDMTHSRKLEQRLAARDKMASLGRVAAGMAHEIRNPLSGINIYLRTLEKQLDSPLGSTKLEPAVKAIRAASGRIESVIRRVMDFSKPMACNFSAIDINLPVTKAATLAKMNFKKKKIHFKMILAENLPKCHAVADLIEEVTLNLISNAVDALAALPRDTPRSIQISTAEEEGTALLIVEDSGSGVPRELKKKIIEPFFTTKPHSTGIGLSLCHRIVSDHGGTIRVLDSDLGGAKFIVGFGPPPEQGDAGLTTGEIDIP